MIEEAKKMAAEIRFQDDEEIPNTDVFRKGADMIDALCAEVERLKQEQAEPMAWMSNGGCGSVIAAEEKNDGFAYTERFCIPLYTAPQGQTALLKQALEALEQIDSAMPFPVGRNVIKEIKRHLGEA